MNMNVLNLTKGVRHTYVLGLDGKESISGTIVCIMDVRFNSGIGFTDAWAQILQVSDTNDGITYAINVIKSSKQWAYVGKTLGTFKNRYANGPTGGLEEVFKSYNPKDCMLECALYNASHPAMVEGWCFQLLAAKKYSVTNIQDPS